MPESIGIYIHVPFCKVRCAYCDFATDLEKPGNRRDWLNCLLQEITQSPYAPVQVDSVYFGGGTPSLLKPEELQEILKVLGNAFSIAKNAEITLEANPEAVHEESLHNWKELGFSRFSVGIQSLNPKELKTLGRGHLKEENLQAIKSLLSSGVNFNLDLMLGIPHQTEETLAETLKELPLHKIPHISCYLLSVEEEAPWFSAVQEGRIRPADEEATAQMYRNLQKTLPAFGLHQYEISAWARQSRQSRHNLKYWKNQPYLGFGPSAGSYLRQRRIQNQRRLSDWKNQCAGNLPPEFDQTLSSQDTILETIMLHFRLSEGVSVHIFEVWDQKFPELKLRNRRLRLENLKLIELEAGFLRIPEKNFLFANRVYAEFLD